MVVVGKFRDNSRDGMGEPFSGFGPAFPKFLAFRTVRDYKESGVEAF